MTSEISFRIFLQVEVVKFLLRANAEVRSKDKFDNTSLNDAVRHRSEFNKEPCLFFFFFGGGGCVNTHLDLKSGTTRSPLSSEALEQPLIYKKIKPVF